MLANHEFLSCIECPPLRLMPSRFKADKEFAQAVFMEMVFKKASPADFRRLAAQDRQNGHHELAYLFEICADRRERGEI
jgi:hypothetical protein